MKIKNIILITILAMTGQTIATGSFESGNTLLSDCEVTSASAEGFECLGYLKAVADTTIAFKGRNNVGKDQYCFPDTITAGQLQKIFIKFANNNPEKLHMNAASIVLESYYYAFPCK